MNGKIIKFPIGQTRQARPGEIFCPPLKIQFPTVYRIVQSMSREQLDAFGLADAEPFSGYNHYTLAEEEDPAHYPGTIERAVIKVLDPAVDQVSLLLRFHGSIEEARAYYEGLGDYGADYRGDVICRTDDGPFTLITRPTRPSWPGPLIIYCAAHVPADNIIGEDSWELAVAPDGTLIERFSDFSDFC